jgi:hypothetical protein
MRSPSAAATLKQKFMRNEHSYRSVFSERVPLDAWPKLAAILKLVDAELNELRSGEKPHLRQKFLKAWRHLVALIVVARILGKFTFRPEEFAKIDLAQVTPETIREVWADVTHLPGYGDVAARRKMKRKFVLDVCLHVADKYGVANPQAIEKGMAPGRGAVPGEAFVNQVHELLPEQPWQAGVHVQVARSIRCRPSEVAAAIDELIRTGKRYRQEHGIVYGPDDEVISSRPS